jgi:hypothetical protein
VKKKVRFYILTTASNRFLEWGSKEAIHDSNYKNLKLHFEPRWSNIPYKDAVVVVNTLNNKKYEKLVQDWCNLKGIECHITESNGSPGKGKNELLKIFEKSDDDYMVQIDGDDILTPYGVSLYKNLANNNPPDSVIIYHQWAQTVDKYGQRKFHGIMNNENRPSNQAKDSKMIYTQVESMYRHMPEYRKEINNMGGIREAVKIFTQYTSDIHDLARIYNETYWSVEKEKELVDNHCRPVWYSKKAAKYRFDEEMKIGEDTRYYLQLKTAHFDGDLVVKRLKEIPCSYVYNMIYGGLVMEHSMNMTNLKWMRLYMDNLQKDIQEGKVKRNPNLPDLLPFLPETVNDYHITEDKFEDEVTAEYDKRIQELKIKIDILKHGASQDWRKLAISMGVKYTAVKYPFCMNIPVTQPNEYGQEHYFHKRIVE